MGQLRHDWRVSVTIWAPVLGQQHNLEAARLLGGPFEEGLVIWTELEVFVVLMCARDLPLPSPYSRATESRGVPLRRHNELLDRHLSLQEQLAVDDVFSMVALYHTSYGRLGVRSLASSYDEPYIAGRYSP
jgi:hypothetical protein